MVMRRNELKEKNNQSENDIDDDSRSEASSFSYQNKESLPKVGIFKKLWSSTNYDIYASQCKYACETALIEIKGCSDQLKKDMKKKTTPMNLGVRRRQYQGKYYSWRI